MQFLDTISISFINGISTIGNIFNTIGIGRIPVTLESLFLNIAPASTTRTYIELMKARHPLSVGFPVDNPFVVLSWCIVYLLFVFIGNRVISKYKYPKCELKYFSMAHNSFLILLSLFMMVESLRQAFNLKYTLLCVGAPNDPKQIGMARIVWIFYFSKIFEMLDTVIMVLKQNTRQITFLHLYHHISIFSVWWAVQHFGPIGEPYFSVFLNSFIHFLMYGYYLLASLGFKIWWKRYLTQMQMTQFFLMMCQGIANLAIGCNTYPHGMLHLMVWYMFSFLVLFANFYLRNYGKETSETKSDKKANGVNEHSGINGNTKSSSDKKRE